MGGYGSTRWNTHWKKTTVEECMIIPISFFKNGIQHVIEHQSKWIGNASWSSYGEKVGEISYSIFLENHQPKVNLTYRIKSTDEDIHYTIKLTSTKLHWGTSRWWFVCPLIKNGMMCNRRVGKLYLPPGGKYFGCRHCYDLTYKSAQEAHSNDFFYSYMAGETGMTTDEARESFRAIEERAITEQTEKLINSHLAKVEERRKKKEEKLSRYLTKQQLSEQTGLSLDEIDKLGEFRLLVPDTKDGRYRPKLIGWGKKLKTRISDDWSYMEIKKWSTKRWEND